METVNFLSQDNDTKEKEAIRDSIRLLKKEGYIRYDSDVARDLGYTRGAVSELLSPTSTKPMTYTFIKKFQDQYGKYLKGIPYMPTKPEDRLTILENTVKVLKDTCIGMLAQSTGKQAALIAAELEDAIKLYNK